MNAPAGATPPVTALRRLSVGEVETLEVGDGPLLVVLMHAAAQHPRAMASLARHLARPERHIVAPLLGPQSAGGTDPIRSYAALARACLTEIPAGRRLLFGHSMGALAALVAAAEGAPHDRLVLYEPIVTALLQADRPADLALRRWDSDIVDHLDAQLAAGTPEGGVARFVEAWNEMAWDRIPAAARERMVADAPELARLVRATSHFPLTPGLLAGLGAPLVILQGAVSPPVTRRMSECLQAAVPGAALRLLPGSGHMGPVMQSAATAEALEELLAETR